MKYSTVRIDSESGEWVVSFSGSDVERVDVDTVPNPLGFYHYRSHVSDEVAFDRLRDCMVRAHSEEIDRLTKSRNKLELLDLGEAYSPV